MKDTVSVIVPVYNREKYIEECVASLQKQTYPALEILLIDDGSTDKTLQICRELANSDPRIRLLETGHGGVSAARNHGIEAAQGTFLFFMDSDDVIHPELIRALVENMECTGAKLGGTIAVNINQKKWDTAVAKAVTDATPARADYKNPQQTLHEALTMQTPLSVIGGVMIRRSLVSETRFRTDLHIGEDFYFVCENFTKGADAVFLQNKWYYVRIHDANSSWDWSYEGLVSRIYRRQLVWENEEKAGRPQYASMPKREAFAIFMKFLQYKNPTAEDKKKMRALMKTYKKVVWPVFNGKTKILFYLTVYVPFVCPVVFWILKRRGRAAK